jgi:FAD:protein FMN transferase
MNATGLTLSARPAWSRVGVGSPDVAVADRDALGTTARLVVWPPENLPRLLAAVDRELALLDDQASRFRDDSEISALHQAGAGTYLISDGLAEAIGIALAAASWTRGLADPTIGTALISLGYDRDFAAIEPSMVAPPPVRDRAPGWQAVRLSGRTLTVPAGVLLDLGATAKGLGADRAARAAYDAAGGGGVLVSLGGDVAVAGRPPAGGWPLLIADEHRQTRAVRNLAAAGLPAAGHVADPAVAQQIRLGRGGLATSSVTCRQWLRAGQVMHHIIDPRTGLPAGGPWRTVSVAAASCAEANAASTAAIIAGDEAAGWLSEQRLPARLIGHDGTIALTGGWPEAEGGRLDPPATSRLAADRARESR